MLARLAAADALVDKTRPGWLGFGQLAVVVLGVHLACDRLDDLCLTALLALPIPVESPDVLAPWATGCALLVELIVVARAFAAIVFTTHAHDDDTRKRTLRDWWNARSVDAIALPVFWLCTSLAGAWVVGMAVEDGIAGLGGPDAANGLARPAHVAGIAATVLIAWRLGLTGLARVIAAFDEGRISRGAAWAPALIGVSALAAWHGVPIWGLLP